jgi:hypothetical protein
MVSLTYGSSAHRYNYENINDLNTSSKETHSVKNENDSQVSDLVHLFILNQSIEVFGQSSSSSL